MARLNRVTDRWISERAAFNDVEIRPETVALILSGIAPRANPNFQMAFVFRKIPFPVRLVQYAPLLAWKINCVLQTLKHDVAAIGTLAMPAQGSERECVSRVVCEVESALKTQGRIACILESGQTGANEPGNLVCRGRFFLHLPSTNQVV
jgi:hypothetical protein